MDRVYRSAWSSRIRCVVQDISELHSAAHDALTNASEGSVLRVKRHTLSAALAGVLAITPPLLLAVTLLPVNDVHANTFTVTTSAPNGVGSLSDAIAAANAAPDSNVIAFASGITSIDANATLPVITHSVTFNTSTNLSIAATLNANVPVTWSGGGTFALNGNNVNLTGGTTIDDSML